MSGTVVNFTFHGIGRPPQGTSGAERALWLDPACFEAYLDALVGAGNARISFDDGNRSDLETALPALLDRGLTASFFVVAGRLGSDGFLGAGDLATLAAEGMTVGCHGMEHASWRGLDPPRLTAELREARRLIAAASGSGCATAACPFGAYDRGVLTSLRTAGIEHVFTSDGGDADPGSWLQARNSLGPSADPAAMIARLLEPAGPLKRSLRGLKQTVKRWR